MLAWTAVNAWYFYGEPKLFGEKSELAVSRIKENSGQGWRYIPTPSQCKDPQRWVRAHLLENGKDLRQNYVTRDGVEKLGGGRYAVSPKNLWFSSTDGSDPKVNGRKYELVVPIVVPPRLQTVLVRAWAWSWLLCLGLLARHAIRDGLGHAWRSNFWRAILVVMVVRLILVSHDEIVATVSDELEYVSLADEWYYHAPPESFYRLPVYPLFIALSGATGLPLKLTLECVQLAAYAFFAGVMLRYRVSPWAAFAIFAWMALSPQMADANYYTMSETLYFPAVLTVISLGLMWVSTMRIAWGAACGVALGLLMNLREERIVALALALTLVGFSVLRWFWNRSSVSPRPPLASRKFVGLASAVLPVVMVAFFVDAAFQAAFYSRTGIWGHCLISTRGLTSFMESMYRIPPQSPPRKYFLIDQKIRDFASTLSSTFRERQHVYETEEIGFRADMQKAVGVYEYTADAFLWEAIWGDVFTDGDRSAVAHRDRLMKQAADEITRGLAGREQQSVYLGGTFPLNATALSLWIGDLRQSIEACLVTAHVPPRNSMYLPCAPTGGRVIELYDNVTHRRQPLGALLDRTSDVRPPWIQIAWSAVYRLQMVALWAACGLALVAVVCGLATSRGRGLLATKVSRGYVAPLVLLALVGLSRLAFTTMTGIYFFGGISPRYLLALTTVSFPVLVLLMDLVFTRREPQGDGSYRLP